MLLDWSSDDAMRQKPLWTKDPGLPEFSPILDFTADPHMTSRFLPGRTHSEEGIWHGSRKASLTTTRERQIKDLAARMQRFLREEAIQDPAEDIRPFSTIISTVLPRRQYTWHFKAL